MSPEMMIPFAGMITGVITTVAIVWGIVQVVRIRTGAARPSSELADEVAALRDQIDALHHALIETQERMDFTERLLAQGRADAPKVT